MILSKLPNTGTTIFTVMSAHAHRLGAINLSQGFPDFDPDKKLLDLYAEALHGGHNQYAPMQGLPALCEVLAEKILALYGCQVSPEAEITVTAGGTQAIFTATASIIHPGDEAIVFDPAYDCYAPSVELLGGTVRPISLHAPDFTIDWDAVKKVVNPKTRVIFINSPHNPLGRVLTQEDIRELEDIVEKYNVFVISDEVYEHIIFDGRIHQSVLRSEVLARRSFACYSFGKLVHATGWKTGYCIAPSALMTEFRKVHQYNVFAVNRPVQHALAMYLGDPATYTQLSTFFQDKRDKFIDAMSGSGFRFLPCEGSYFILADYSELSMLDDMTFALRLTVQGGVATIPLSPFYHRPPESQRVVRFCFGKKDETLQEAAGLLSGVKQVL